MYGYLKKFVGLTVQNTLWENRQMAVRFYFIKFGYMILKLLISDLSLIKFGSFLYISFS